jgi:hypothetical protein
MALGSRPLASRPLASEDVTPGGANSLTAPLGTLTLSALVPTFQQSVSIVAPLGTLTLSGLVPTFAQANSLTVPLGALTLAGLVPQFAQGTLLSVPLGSLTLSGLIPSFSQGNSLGAPLGQLTLSGLIPSFAQTGPQSMIAPLGALILVGLQVSFVVTGISDYGGVWLYGLKHWQRLRQGQHVEEEDEEIPLPVVEEIATVVARIPEPVTPDDTEARLLLRLELEGKRQVWRASYIEALAAYREGYREMLLEMHGRQLESLRAAQQQRRRRQLAHLLLLAE